MPIEFTIAHDRDVKVGPTLYTTDATGVVRTWRMEISGIGNQYRTVAGIEGGAQVESAWTAAEPKNVGRSNATTAVQQAELEVRAQYQKKLDRKYHTDRQKVGGYKFFAPMLAHKYEGWKDFPSVYTQPKLDGIRALIGVEGATTRQGKPIATIPHVLEALRPVFEAHPDLVLDGELYNHELRDDFNELSSVIRRPKPSAEDLVKAKKLVQYHIYDAAAGFEGSFGARIGSLHTLIAYGMGFDVEDPLYQGPADNCIRFVKTYNCRNAQELDQAYAKFLEDGYEGQMVRLPYVEYEEGKRSKSLLKRKEFEDLEVELVAVHEGVGNWAGHAKTAVIRLPDGRTQSSGMRGSKDFLQKVLADWRRFSKVTVRFQNKTPDGLLRFPVITDWHEGERND